MAGGVTITYEHMDDLQRSIESLESNNPRMRKQIQTIVRTVLKKASSNVRKVAKSHLNNDPRKAYLAVRMAVYKKILGGNISILSRRRNNGKQYVGGSHSRLSLARTKQLNGYYGSDRGFILRFVNSGTVKRTATNMDAHPIARSKHDPVLGAWKNHTYHRKRIYKDNGTVGNRGAIQGSDWFGSASQIEIENAAVEMDELINRAIQEVWQQS